MVALSKSIVKGETMTFNYIIHYIHIQIKQSSRSDAFLISQTLQGVTFTIFPMLGVPLESIANSNQ